MIIGGLVVVSLLAMALTVFVNLHKFDNAFEATVNDRFYFDLDDARDILEAEMRLGQSLEKLSNAQAALDEAKAVDQHVLSIEVFNEDGRTLYSTDNSFLFDIVPNSWEHAWRQAGNGRWEMIDDEAVTLGVGLQDLLAQPVGSLVLRYSTQLQENVFSQIKKRLFENALWLWGGAVTLMFFLVLYLTRPLKLHFQNIESGITHFLDANKDVISGTDEIASNDHVNDFMQGYRLAEAELAQLESTLEKMDGVGK